MTVCTIDLRTVRLSDTSWRDHAQKCNRCEVRFRELAIIFLNSLSPEELAKVKKGVKEELSRRASRN